jgi:hypothetical protein
MRAEIIKWNPINGTKSLKSSIYIKPTLEILDFFNRSPFNRVVIKIKETNSCYDDQNMFAIIDKSSDVMNKRDNFFDSTGLYVMTLDRPWQGFPEKNGYVEFQEGIVNDIIDFVSNCQTPSLNLNDDRTKLVKENFVNGNNSIFDDSDQDERDIGDEEDDYKEDRKDKNNCKSKGMDLEILIISGLAILLLFSLITINN